MVKIHIFRKADYDIKFLSYPKKEYYLIKLFSEELNDSRLLFYFLMEVVRRHSKYV